jgi:hypothetical protein
LVEDPIRERKAVFTHKLRGLATACVDYLRIARQSAVRVTAERSKLRSAILDERVRGEVIDDELTLAAKRVSADFSKNLWPQFDDVIGPLQYRLAEELRVDMREWRGHLGRQTRHFEDWLRGKLTTELAKVTPSGAQLARQLLEEAEVRFRRIVDAFRDRLARNVTQALNLSLSPLAWTVHVPEVIAPDPALSKTVDTSWAMLWWAIPMPLFGWFFHWHFLGLVPWEVDKNVRRLFGGWCEAFENAVENLREQALTGVRVEIATLNEVLDRQSDEVPLIEDAIRCLEAGLAGACAP